MSLPLSTPDEIADEPELAPLLILLTAAEVTRRALLAAQPELLDSSFLADEPGISPRQCLAASLIVALETATTLGENYRAHLDRLAARTRPIKMDISY